METLTGLRLECAVAGRTLPGETISGDGYLLKVLPDSALLAVIDGLGHGDAAARASRIAVHMLERYAQEPIERLFERSHRRLLHTHGVAMTLARFHHSEDQMSWIGVGNVSVIRVRHPGLAMTDRFPLHLHAGVVGARMPVLQNNRVDIALGDLFLLATDGIHQAFVEDVRLEDPVQQIADLAIERHFLGTDDAFILVARYLGARR